MSVAAQPEMPAAVSDDERAAACALAGLNGIGAQSLALIRAEHASLAAAVRKGGPVLAKVPGLRADGIAALESSSDLVRRGTWLLETARGMDARVILLGEPEYPELLAAAAGAPPVLYVQGRLAASGTRRVAVVGTRDADDYGTERTQAIVDQLCAAGVEVVSGGAVGIDKAAHRRAVERQGQTIGVLGCGFRNLYPAGNEALYKSIAAHGALVSEFALDSGGIRTHFPQRNRTMAGLCEAVVITRGSADSGALTTCQTAMKLGRLVFAVPGRVGEELAAAPNSMLALGARAALTGEEVVRALGLTSAAVPTQAPPAPVAPAPDVSGLPATVQVVFGRLGPAPRHVDELATEASLSTGECLSALLQLELAGLCVSRPGKYFLRR